MEELNKKVDILSKKIDDLIGRVAILEMDWMLKNPFHGNGGTMLPSNWTPDDVARLEELRARRRHQIRC